MTPPKFSTVLGRALRKKCPSCGGSPLYRRWYRLNPSCTACGYDFNRDPIDILSFLYISTALITGFVVLLMFGVSSWVPAAWMRFVVLVVAVGAMLLTLPIRKSLAIALDYWTREHWER